MKNIIISGSKRVVVNSKETVVFPTLAEVDIEKDIVVIPTKLLDKVSSGRNVKLYFELENDAFFQKLKDLLSKTEKPKGVFRYRRITASDKNESLLVEDIIMITSLFGEPEAIFVKRSNDDFTPKHVIVTLNFGGGTMAHVEYTLLDKEQIEFDWCGIQQIIEFNSDEMSALISETTPSSALTMRTDTILENAHTVDENVLAKLAKYRNLLDGGMES
ncbi:hypothetical protein ACFOUV_14745 [Oceanobacillus longus]|uniref:Uncharacterized protein n=1 Tax=Oceanobacillus longus TaxID=930120 RepID=A0ABV8GZF6_9BACI